MHFKEAHTCWKCYHQPTNPTVHFLVRFLLESGTPIIFFFFFLKILIIVGINLFPIYYKIKIQSLSSFINIFLVIENENFEYLLCSKPYKIQATVVSPSFHSNYQKKVWIFYEYWQICFRIVFLFTWTLEPVTTTKNWTTSLFSIFFFLSLLPSYCFWFVFHIYILSLWIYCCIVLLYGDYRYTK